MKIVRVALIAAATLLACALVLAAVLCTSGVQTWVVRRALATQPGWHATVRAVAVGLDEVRLRDLRIERHGIVLTLPSVALEIPPISAGLQRKVLIRRFVAKGWTLDLTGVKGGLTAARRSAAALGISAAGLGPTAAAETAPDFSFLSAARADSPPSAAAARAFSGIFSRLNLPMDLSLDGLELEGDVLLPPAPGTSGTIRAHLLFGGGGLGAGSEGRFTFSLAVALPAKEAPVSALNVDGTLAAAMSTPRTFNLFSARINAAATGAKFPAGVRLSGDFGAVRAAAGETYTATLAGDSKLLATVQGDYAGASHRLGGKWKLDVCDDDVSPFALGRVLPLFTVVGEGRFDTDATLSQTHVSGRLNLAADRLTAIRPEFSAIGAVKLVANFDLTHRGGLLRVDHLQANLAGAEPILTLQALQAFAFNADTGELEVADATRDLLGLTLQGVPVEWSGPFLREVVLTGNHLRGELIASARNGGLTLRSKTPLSVSGLSATRRGRMLFRDATVSVDTAADYTPLGWQVEVQGHVPGPAHSTALVFSSKWGRLAGPGQAIKGVGHIEADLPTLLTASTWTVAASPAGSAPAEADGAALTRGRLVGDLTASLGARRSIKANFQVSDLAANPALTAEALPAIAVEVRADFDADGKTVFSMPVTCECGGRKSDVTVSGTLVQAPAGVTLEGQVTSVRMVVADLKILGASLAATANPEGEHGDPPRPGAAAAAPFWSGVLGRLQLSLKKVELPNFTLADVGGTVRLEQDKLSAEGWKAALAEGSDCRLAGELVFVGAAPEMYSLQAAVLVNNFDPAPVFQSLNPGQPPTVEGKFNLSAQLSGRGSSLGDLAARVRGDCQVTSRGGVFRMLSTGMSPKTPNSGKVAAIGNFIGDLATAVTGRKDAEKKIQAVLGLAQTISPIQFDQMSLVLTRDAALDTEMKDFALISPEMRLGGGGKVAYQEGAPLFDQPMALNFKLSARGHTGDLLKTAGVLGTTPDELGYVACTLPIKIGGTLGKPDTSELQATLLKAAYDKSGAGDLLDKLLGK